MKAPKQTNQKTTKPSCLLTTIFYASIANYILVLSQIFIPTVSELFAGSLLFLLPFFIFSLLGLTLIFLTVREKMTGRLKKSLILTGVSAFGILACSVLHNLTYAIGIYFFQKEFEEPVFFLLAVIILPVVFLFAAISSLYLLLKKKKL
jgi:hypothetical protein